MTTIVTRVTTQPDSTAPLGVPLSSAQIDQNFINLNVNKLESTWTGNTSVVTLGTITTGTWNGTTIAIANGGTGSTSASTARTSLGLQIGLNVQAYGAELDGLAANTSSTGVVIRLGAGSYSSTNAPVLTSVQATSIGVGTAPSGTSGRLDATSIVATTITETSSIVYKENINPIQNALTSISALQGVLFDWIGKPDSVQSAGLIAEDVKKYIPEVVTVDKDGNAEGVQYSKLVAYLIECVKELKQEIDTLKGIK